MNTSTRPEPRFRGELGFLQILLTLFQDFDHGRAIEQLVPTEWDLQPGDRMEFEAGCNISGIARVTSVGQPSETVPGRTRCTFVKH